MNHRQKKRKLVITTLSLITVAILSLTIAYAELSEMLTISGSGTVTSVDWDIAIANSTNKSNKATGTATYTTPVVSGTTISYTINLKKPGDSVTLYFDVKNEGDINAQISSVINSTPVCTSSTGNTSDANLVCDNLDIKMNYASGYSITNGDVVNQDEYLCRNGYTEGYYKAIIEVKITLNESLTTVPTSDVTISNMKHDIIYTQSEKKCTKQTGCFVEGTKVLTENGYKSIEDIEKGEYVYAMNVDTNTYELKKVLRKIENETNKIYKITVNDKVIETTEKHEIYVIDKGWIAASELKVGDKLSSMDDVDTEITKIEIEEYKEQIPVYNMEVEGHHNYLITDNNFLVHNAGSAM